MLFNVTVHWFDYAGSSGRILSNDSETDLKYEEKVRERESGVRREEGKRQREREREKGKSGEGRERGKKGEQEREKGKEEREREREIFIIVVLIA